MKVKKRKRKKCARKYQQSRILIDPEQLKEVEEYKYLGRLLALENEMT